MKMTNKIGLVILIAVLAVFTNFIATFNALNISLQPYKLLFIIILLPAGILLCLRKLLLEKKEILAVVSIFIVTVALYDLVYNYLIPFIPRMGNFDFRPGYTNNLKFIVELIFWQPFLPRVSLLFNMAVAFLYFLTGLGLFLFKEKARIFVLIICGYYLTISIAWFFLGAVSYFRYFHEFKMADDQLAVLFSLSYYLKSILFYVILLFITKRNFILKKHNR